MAYFRNENPAKIVDTDKPENRSGFVYVVAGEEYGVPVYEMRKPSPLEREAIVMEYVRRHNGLSFKVSWLAGKLGVSDRAIQKILSNLSEKGAIRSEPNFGKDGRQSGSIYFWTGNVDPIVGAPTLKDLYHRKNDYGFRSFTWDDFKVVPGSLTRSKKKLMLIIAIWSLSQLRKG